MTDIDLRKVGTEFRAVLMNPPWNYDDPNYPIFKFEDFVIH